jgi:hypothetical protein
MMNDNSLKKEFLKSLLLLSIFVSLAIILLIVFPSTILYAAVPFLFAIARIYIIILDLIITDIEFCINDNYVTLTYLFKKKVIFHDMIKIFDIYIERIEAFKLETNFGNIYVHYTKLNYDVLLNYLMFIEYPKIDSLKKEVRMYGPFAR